MNEEEYETHYLSKNTRGHHYLPRYLIQVDSVRGDMDSPREGRTATDDYEYAVGEVNQIDRYRNVYLVDRLRPEYLPALNAYGRGYYGLSYSGLEVEHYLDGKIARLAAKALDKIDRDVDTCKSDADRSWYAYHGPATLILNNRSLLEQKENRNA